MSNIASQLENAQENFYCRVFILYANTPDAEVIYDEIKKQEMHRADYVWIVSEQVGVHLNQS